MTEPCWNSSPHLKARPRRRSFISVDTIARQIVIAEGFVLLDLLVEAWDALEALPPSSRTLPEALQVRLMICTRLDHWEMGKVIAAAITPGHDYHVREAAGRFHLGHAIALCAAGDVPRARAAIGALSAVWPEGRPLAVDCDALAAVW